MEHASNSASGLVLPLDLLSRALEFLDANERALNVRLVSKEICERFSGRQHGTARFSLPLPENARNAAWQPHLQQAMKHSTYDNTIKIFSTAASSGCEVNLQLAWGLLRPYLPLAPDRQLYEVKGAGPAAIKAGHLELLTRIAQLGAPVDTHRTLEAAAKHLDLAGLQAVWEQLGWEPPANRGQEALCELLMSAGRSSVAAAEKLEWLLSMASGRGWLCLSDQVQAVAAAAGAAAAGSLPLLTWLRGQSVDWRRVRIEDWEVFYYMEPMAFVISEALLHGHVAVADWLVDEAGITLPHQQEEGQDGAGEPDGREKDEEGFHDRVWREVAASGNEVVVRWLLARGVPVELAALQAAAEAGQLDMLRFLHKECGLGLPKTVFAEGARSRSLPTMRWLLQAGCPMSPEAYNRAAFAGDAAMVLWLLQEAGCPWSVRPFFDTMPEVIRSWSYSGSGKEELLQLVRTLVAAGCPHGGERSMTAAALHGYLPVLRYLHEELGVGFGYGTLAAAAEGGCEAVLEWLVGAGCVVGGGEWGDPYVCAGFEGNAVALGCLRRLGVPWSVQVLRWAVQRGVSLSVLRWLVEQGAPWDEGAVVQAVDTARASGVGGDALAWFQARFTACRQ